MNSRSDTVSMSRGEFDHIGELLATIKSQNEMIARLTAERAELQRRKMQADRRRQEVFRLPTGR